MSILGWSTDLSEWQNLLSDSDRLGAGEEIGVTNCMSDSDRSMDVNVEVDSGDGINNSFNCFWK